MPQLWFPKMLMTLVTRPTKGRPNRAVFKIAPSMNKFEVKEYLQKIYDIPVKRVMTQNYMGKRKRILGARGVWAYKRPDFKRAIVTIDYGHDSSTTAGRSSAA